MKPRYVSNATLEALRRVDAGFKLYCLGCQHNQEFVPEYVKAETKPTTHFGQPCHETLMVCKGCGAVETFLSETPNPKSKEEFYNPSWQGTLPKWMKGRSTA